MSPRVFSIFSKIGLIALVLGIVWLVIPARYLFDRDRTVSCMISETSDANRQVFKRFFVAVLARDPGIGSYKMQVSYTILDIAKEKCSMPTGQLERAVVMEVIERYCVALINDLVKEAFSKLRETYKEEIRV